MPFTFYHPQYSAVSPDWNQMADCFGGQRVIKSKRTTYLPATSGMIQDGMENPNQLGYKAYEAYLTRARYPGYVRESIENLVGMLHHLPAEEMELPAKMESLRSRCSAQGESLEQLLRRINMQQLLFGRIGLLADLPENASSLTLPYIATYNASRIVNWDDGSIGLSTEQNLNLVILDESEYVRSADFSWNNEEKYRVLILTPGADSLQGEYRMGVFDGSDINSVNEEAMFAPSYMGRTLDRIPFTFINAADVVPAPDKPPLLDLSELCLTIYRGEADYRQSLFLQGQDTLVTIGALMEEDDAGVRVGAGSSIDLPIGGDAKFIGVDSSGLAEQRGALENDRNEAGAKGGMLLDTLSRERESGDSLQTRLSARTASLNDVARAGAFGLQENLRMIARWMDLDPESVIIKPNMDFGDPPMSTQSVVEMTAARNQGAPLSAKSIHAILARKGFTKMSYDEELEAVKAEKGTPFDRAVVGSSGDLNPANAGPGQRSQSRKED